MFDKCNNKKFGTLKIFQIMTPGLKITSRPISVSAQTLHMPPHPVTNTNSPLLPWWTQIWKTIFIQRWTLGTTLCKHTIAKALPSSFRQHSTKTSNQSTSCSYSLSTLEKNVHKISFLADWDCWFIPSREKEVFYIHTGCEYDPGKKPTKSEKLKTSPKKDTSTEKQTKEPQPSLSITSEVDPEMPQLEDIRPKKKLRFKDPI